MKSLGCVVASLVAGCLSVACSNTDADSSSPAAAAERSSRPRPAFYVPAGTNLTLVLDTTVASDASQPGDRVDARLVNDLHVDGRVVVPAGSTVRGHVTAAIPAGHVKGRARLAFDFDALVVGGDEQAIEARAVDITAENSHGRDAAILGGSAGAGALIGAIANGKKGAALGALLGAGAGTGVVLTNTGKEVHVPAGTTVSVELTQATRILGG